jgi:phage gp45-like
VIDIKAIAAKIRNLFCISDFQKRYNDDDRIQVKTHNGKVLEKNEAFPYGFYAKAKSGKAIIFCQGGNFDNFEILPVLKDKAVFRPALEDGDAAIYTGEGSYIVLREKGGLEIYTRQKGDIKVFCEGNAQETIEKDARREIIGNSTETIGGNEDRFVDGNHYSFINGNGKQKVSGNYAWNIDGSLDINVAGKVRINGETIHLN